MRVLQLTTLFGAVLVVLLMFTGTTTASPLSSNPLEPSNAQNGHVQSRVGMVQTLTCTNPTCSAQCRGRGYRRGSCTIGRCFCSYV